MAKKKGKQKNNSNSAAMPAIPKSIPTNVPDTMSYNSMAPVMLKMCRLCEAKDGPFLNIFGMEQAIAKKIDLLLPFSVSEYDDLPHKICFRCSAKVEELHDFVQKCVSAQDNLRKLLGKTHSLPKTRTRKIWEEKLNQSNMSNDEICNAVIEKAMEGIKDLPLNPLPLEQIEKEEKKERGQALLKKKTLKFDMFKEMSLSNIEVDVAVNKSKLLVNKSAKMSFDIAEAYNAGPKTTRSATTAEISFDYLEPPKTRGTEIARGSLDNKHNFSKDQKQTRDSARANEINQETPHMKNEPRATFTSESEEDTSEHSEENRKTEQSKPKQEEKIPQIKKKIPEQPFDIMKHICKIKVNGVGVLFQCKLCNRNFLKKDVVMSHGCAKTGIPKHDHVASPANVEYKNPINSVKYINNKPKTENQSDPQNSLTPQTEPETKQKPKVGPASRVKKTNETKEPSVIGMRVTPREVTPPPLPPQSILPNLPAIEVPPIPGLKSRYRLVPGPNNTFTLVEDSTLDNTPNPSQVIMSAVDQRATKRKSDDVPEETPPPVVQPKKPRGPKSRIKPQYNQDIINLDDEPRNESMPYPVGLFQTMASNEPPKMHQPPIMRAPVLRMPTLPTPNIPTGPVPVTFTTPAMKKQSYTVVQTGNPSKLLISARPQVPKEPAKPKSKRKNKHEPRVETQEQPFNVTLEDKAPPKDPGFFTFINVDPLLQPSYVLPTDNIIQESQISTSTAAAGSSQQGGDLYECSMCPEKFTREKKLLVHIQSHYNKMDEESRLSSERRRKCKKY